jgi:hypothetical protein
VARRESPRRVIATICWKVGAEGCAGRGHPSFQHPEHSIPIRARKADSHSLACAPRVHPSGQAPYTVLVWSTRSHSPVSGSISLPFTQTCPPARATWSYAQRVMLSDACQSWGRPACANRRGSSYSSLRFRSSQRRRWTTAARRSPLRVLQAGWARTKLWPRSRSDVAVDHFVPWRRYPFSMAMASDDQAPSSCDDASSVTSRPRQNPSNKNCNRDGRDAAGRSGPTWRAGQLPRSSALSTSSWRERNPYQSASVTAR